MIHGAYTMHQGGGSKLKVSPHQLSLKVSQHKTLSIQVLLQQLIQVAQARLVDVLLELKTEKGRVVANLVGRVVEKDQMLLSPLSTLCLHGLTKSLMFGNLKINRLLYFLGSY